MRACYFPIALLLSLVSPALGAPADVDKVLSDYELSKTIRSAVEADNRQFVVWTLSQKPTSEEMFAKAEALRGKWAKTALPRLSAPLLANAYAMSAGRADLSADQRSRLTEWATELLSATATFPVVTADEVFYKLMRSPEAAPVASSLDRVVVLEALLQLYSRVEDYWPNAKSGVETNAEGRIVVTGNFDLYPNLPVDELTVLTKITDPAVRAKCAAVLEDWNNKAEQTAMYAWFGPRNQNRREGLLKDTTNHINRAFTMEPGDLAIVQASLEKHVPNSAHRERLVLTAYKGTNPFAVQPQGVEGAAKVGTRRAMTNSKQGSINNAVGAEGTKSVAGHPAAAADSVPLATTSSTTGGLFVLWSAFAGAFAVIVAILWRAQARAHPGRPK